MAKRRAPARQYVEVAPAVPLAAIAAQTYTYHLEGDDANKLATGQIVQIPFGRRHVRGVVVGMHRRKVRFRTKPVSRLFDERLQPEQLAFTQWLATTMQGGVGYTARLFVPAAAATTRTKKLSSASQTAFSPTAAEMWETLERRPGAVIDHDQVARGQRLAELAAHAVARGMQVLILVPEKQLLAPLLAAVTSAVPSALVVTVTAEAGVKMLRKTAHMVASGQPSVVIGTQKALFLPFKKLGLIVVEEEFYPTYKLWDQYPRLHTVLGAEQLQRFHKARLLFSTSVVSLRLRHAINASEVTVFADQPVMTRPKLLATSPFDRTRRRLLPESFETLLAAWMAKRQRVVILHNRKGAWQVMHCRSCQTPIRCPDCQIALRVHGMRPRQRLVCEQCGHTAAVPKVCPKCGEQKLTVFGPGSERIEASVRPLLPRSAQLLTVSAESTPPRLARTLGGQVILGTNALFRWLPAGSVDQVLYLFPERDLLYPDYRSEEKVRATMARLQQLLSGTSPLYLVTRQPRMIEPSLTAPLAEWYEAQLKERRRLSYPPYSTMVRLTIATATHSEALERALRIRHQLAERAQDKKMTGVLLRGPFESFVRRRRGKAEAHLLLLGDLPQLTQLYDGIAAAVDVMPERVL